MKDQPFSTNNRRLALALITAGCTLAPRDQNGPAINIYTAGKLRDLRIVKPAQRLTEKELEIYTLEAVEKQREGDVSYLFVQDAALGRCIKAFDEIEENIKKARAWEAMTDTERAEAPDRLKPRALDYISEEVVMQVLSYHSETEKVRPQIVFANPPLCSTMSVGSDQPSGEECSHGVTAGTRSGKGARVWSTHLNNADRERMKLHPRIAK